MATNRVGPLHIDQGALLAAVVRSPAYRKTVERYAGEKAAELQIIGKSFYASTLQDANEMIQQGVTGGTTGRSRLSVSMPYGGNAYVAVAWPALSQTWLDDKARRASRRYAGNHPSIAPRLFWVDEGKLLRAFGDFIQGKAQAHADATVVNIGPYQWLVTFRLEFKELPIRFLDSALRRALMQGADAKQRARGVQDMTGMPRGKDLQGVYRAAWAEAYRPMMRPLAMRLGKAMQEQIIQTLSRR